MDFNLKKLHLSPCWSGTRKGFGRGKKKGAMKKYGWAERLFRVNIYRGLDVGIITNLL